MGNPVVHFEFWSDAPASTAEFYTRAFDWKMEHVPELAYWMADTDGAEGNKGMNGGIFRPDGEASSWPAKTAIYIQVPALAPALERVVAAGGSILVERKEIPGMGALSLFSDPDGRVVGLWEMGV
ncbi:MAG: VOC family protein [Thermoanaerobaculia bacterium]